MARRFSREELESMAGASVPDLIGPGVRLLFVGINPGLWTAATQTHFAYPGNKFYPALHRSGLVPHLIDVHEGMTDGDRADLVARGIGITNIVNRATARADQLDRPEIEVGGARLRELVAGRRPAVVAILGITTYRTAFGRPLARRGLQPEGLAGAELHVLGNPSGLNAHETVDTLAEAFADLGNRAGLPA
jgi:TDG/mug DNA glycosylase family protein